MSSSLRGQRVAALVAEDGSTHVVVQQRHPARSYGRQFVILFVEAMAEIAVRARHGFTLRVLSVLPEFLDFTSFKPLPMREVGARFNANPGNVSRAMAELQELGVVEKDGKGPRTVWRLSSDWGWNGTAEQFHAFRAGRLKGKRPPVPLGAEADKRNYGKFEDCKRVGCVLAVWHSRLLGFGVQ